MPQPNMNKMLKQVQQMQAEMMKAQEQLKDEVVEATAGGGMVTVKVTGDLEVKEIAISPDALGGEEDARVDGAPVEQDGADAAFGLEAVLLGAREAEVEAEHVEERPVLLGRHLVALAVDGATKDTRCGDPAAAQTGRQGGDFPMSVRRWRQQPQSARRPAIASRHIGGGPSLVDKDQVVGIERGLTADESATLLGYVGAILLGGM